ncbi:MAG TPA: NAD-dependent dehydratase [Candidatus Taylorbacteria bacterium]|nr:MAG: NAD-dependent epimerase/dehydratase [Parcubacteria group bacterium GW2011_GWA2_47_64]KKU96556.1 MAG: NAD-dependent epimerase/dehydratase [Parcubacteria group bacterium GW2011_GWC2_48_17]HBV01215.1 NAD-dependent dehydratase [Candidatus Taylorbacteria bacterium]
MAKPKILILGGAGYVGGHMTDLFIAKGYAVTVYDSLLYESRFLKDVPFIRGDVREETKLSALLPQFDIVVALAAIVGDEACALDHTVTKAVNVESIRWLSKHFKGKIIFASTCSVYGANGRVLSEDSPTSPLSLYAETKIEAEKILLASPHKDKHIIFRFATLFGLGDRFTRPRFDLVVNAFSKNAAAGETLKVFGGDRWRPLVHVKDIAEATLYAVENNLSGLYNVAQSNWQIASIAKEVQFLAPGKIGMQQIKLRSEDLRDYKVSGKKLEKKGFAPKRTLKDGIREVYALVSEGRIKNTADPAYSNAAFLKIKSS